MEEYVERILQSMEDFEVEQRKSRLAAAVAHGPGHTCKACRSPFHSFQKRDSLCGSCRRIIARWIERLENEVCGMEIEAAKQRVFSDLACQDCSHHRWSGRKTDAPTMEVLLQKLPKWVELAHCHFMRHVFFNRFPYSRQFFPRFQDPKIATETYKMYFCPKTPQTRTLGDHFLPPSSKRGVSRPAALRSCHFTSGIG